MENKTIRRALILLSVLFIVGGISFALLQLSNTSGFPVKSSGKALIGGSFELTDHTGKTVTEKTFQGKLMLVFFGFTHCPDICPADLQVMTSALDQIGDSAKEIRPLFITIDPERDTQENLAAYVSNFHESILGLHGSKEQIAKAAKAYRIYYKKIINKDYPDDYTMDHTSLIYLMGRKGEYLTHYPYGTSPEKMAASLKKHL